MKNLAFEGFADAKPIPDDILGGLLRGLIVDGFAGGGGASTGIEWALGRSPDVAINTDAAALAMHGQNHPRTLHLNKNIWKADPMTVTAGQPVGLMWASPDCRDHSKAKGGRPVSRSVRALAWVVVSWARQVRPKVILLENVEEFEDWGPIDAEGNRCKKRKGQEFKRWVAELARLGYDVEWRRMRACDYGAPTTRNRLFLVARCDGLPIVWPASSHGDPKSAVVRSGGLLPWRTAAEIIDWDRPCPSIFMARTEARHYKLRTGVKVNRPLARNTMARIAAGTKRYILDAEKPFIVTCNHSGDGFRGQDVGEPFKTVAASRDAHGLVSPTMIQTGYGERDGQSPRALDIHKPLGTAVAGGGKHAVVSAYLAQHNAGPRPGAPGRDVREPMSTPTTSGSQQAVVSAHMLTLKGSDRRASSVEAPAPTACAKGQHNAVVMPTLTVYYGSDEDGAGVDEPMRTVTSKPRFGLVEAEAVIPPMTPEQEISARRVAAFLREFGAWDDREFVTVGPYVIVDLGMRMLTPRELARAQGFPDSYVLAANYNGRTLNETEQRRMIGNSVSPFPAAALVRANMIDAAQMKPLPRRRLVEARRRHVERSVEIAEVVGAPDLFSEVAA
ncbi:DNA cytosine methyltransferase [Ancylobacter amanitiformis]|uniref:DNA (cytosine-5-)-methyltransferase n=1 Tax=Ancylobacter amanitiformis TaxID=217069 RepID=A0ABU0LQD6_9HYPH|nr:DNA cytosine methyltransferase [Ancylobacter amanitiformis]MDQ0510923.1 DNA (cytosine-5)-methyltransferase 1 [Ancylobacter amanitiformis]